MGDAYKNAEKNDENGNADGETMPAGPCDGLLLGLAGALGGCVSG